MCRGILLSLVDMEELAGKIKKGNFMFLDVEYIQTTKSHQCVRKFYILGKNGNYEYQAEFYPCKRFHELDEQFKKAFCFCRKNIHKLTYNPIYYSPQCRTALSVIQKIVTDFSCDFILYKGGTIERDICERIGVQSYNIECLGGLQKALTHNPREEVQFYMKQLNDMGLL